MACNPALATECGGNDTDQKVAFTPRTRPGVPLMQMGLVNHLNFNGFQPFTEDIFDLFSNFHGFSGVWGAVSLFPRL
jgi:hypothetical protein